MVKILPYILVSNGQKAIELYRYIFDAKLVNHQPFTAEIVESMEIPIDFDLENSTMHAVLEIGGMQLYLADNNQGTKDYGHVEITLECDTEAQIKKFYSQALEKGCETKMALQKYNWGWYARIIDPFGVGWQLNFNEG